MLSMPLVSVIIPVYNRRNIIDETISSVLNQDYENIEIIISDNCSSDGTFEHLLSHYGSDKRFLLLQNKENFGPVENWKACLKHCKGKYTKILWSDDKITENFVSLFVQVLENNDDVAFCISNVNLFDETFNRPAIVFDKPSFVTKKQYMHSLFCDIKMPKSPGCALLRTKDIVIDDRIDNFFKIDHYRTGAGIDSRIYLNALLPNEYKKVYVSPACCSYFREHKGSITVQNDLIMREYYVSDLDFILRHNLDKEFAVKMFPKIIRFEKKHFEKKASKIY